MADRGGYRGGRGGGAHGHHRGGRGGGGRGGTQAHGGPGGEQKEKAKKENILDLAKYMDKRITVKFSGGREGKLLPLDCLPSKSEELIG
jgi:U6 snRNA-associated Sm-like protein LSm7